MATYQVIDSSNRKINRIEWDGETDISGHFPDCTVALDDGTDLWTPPPAEVTRRQMMLALYQLGKLDAIKAIVALAGGAVQIEWDEALDFERGNPVLTTYASVNGWTDTDLDNLFTLAGSL